MSTPAFGSGPQEPETPMDKAVRSFAAGLGAGLADGLLHQLSSLPAPTGTGAAGALWSYLIVPAVVALVVFILTAASGS